MRIVSLVPSASEIVAHLGAASMLVGRSHECDYPDAVLGAPILTGPRTPIDACPSVIDQRVHELQDDGSDLYLLDSKGLVAVCPELVLTQELCSVCSVDLPKVVRAVQGIDPAPQIESLSPVSIEDIFDDIIRVGSWIGMDEQARHAVVRLRQRLDRAAEHTNPYDDGPSVSVLEWTDPLFVAGHWGVQIVERSGARHPLNETTIVPGSGAAVGPQQAQRVAGPSIAVTERQLVESSPAYLVIAPCGRTLEQARADAQALMEHAWFRGLPAVRERRVAIVDGTQMFARPGPRVVDALEFMTGWINDRPGLIPEDFPWALLEV